MKSYELTFHVAEIPANLADDLLDRFDCVIGEDHGGQPYITITADGADCVSAAKAMTTQLQLLGMIVQRLEEDLANRNEIAERLGVTRQAVSNWVRGQRGSDFPAPTNDVAGGVWLWGDVARWAETHGSYDTNGMNYPFRADYDRVNGWLVDGCMVPAASPTRGWLKAPPIKVFVSWRADVAMPAKVAAWVQQQVQTAQTGVLIR
jgi:predicted XRE-type DNA-binding protein